MTTTPILSARKLRLWYGDQEALKGISINIQEKEVTAFIGPSGCGKSTLLRCFNRMNDNIPGCRMEGGLKLGVDTDINAPALDVVQLRTRVGMVFQKPNPFPKTIYDNIAYAPGIHGLARKGSSAMDDIVEKALTRASLWNEVKDKLNQPGTALSGGQQQRLCIARAIAMQPEIILMDEPCSALDPIATSRIEDLISELKERFTIVMVTHNMQQAARSSDKTAFFYLGDMIEFGPTEQLFSTPQKRQTEDYITGRFG